MSIRLILLSIGILSISVQVANAGPANRRAATESQPNVPVTGSPVDAGTGFPPNCALLIQLMRETKKLKTRWRSKMDSNQRYRLLDAS
jgi:hypothetical protein